MKIKIYSKTSSLVLKSDNSSSHLNNGSEAHSTYCCYISEKVFKISSAE